MESFVRRLKFYGIGFGLGLIFVFFFFRNRGCSWLPENRVKNSILDRLVVVSDKTAAEMEGRGITEEDVIDALNHGDVYFSESDKDGESKAYVIESQGMKFAYTLPYESFVSEVFLSSEGRGVKTSDEGWGTILHFPNDSTLVFPDSTSMLSCKLERLNLNRSGQILEALKSSARVDFSQTNLSIRPKPEHYLVFQVDTLEVGAEVIWYKNKLNIHDLHFEGDRDCK